ncbi:IS3 family transposase [Aeromicrobium sp. YIM 150415]|uniref:IS3 family transposase n=1 Tax=Aeromicrobium sp. YIM 150415 TaxID=2803912 RepID=UPI0035AB888E
MSPVGVHAELQLEMGLRLGRKRVARLMREARIQDVCHQRAADRRLVNRGPLFAPSWSSMPWRWLAGNVVPNQERSSTPTAEPRTHPGSSAIAPFHRVTRIDGSRRLQRGQRGHRVVLVDHATRELLDRHDWVSRTELATAIFEWIEGWYNPCRRHTSIRNLSPAEFEALHNTATQAARSPQKNCPGNRGRRPRPGPEHPHHQRGHRRTPPRTDPRPHPALPGNRPTFTQIRNS